MTQPTIFVTGADGLLGSNTVRELINQGYQIKALIQAGRKVNTLEGLDLEKVEGDLLDTHSLLKAMEGCHHVVHIAANTTMWPDRNPRVRSININGTQNIISACKDLQIQRLVYVGTANSFGFGSKENPGTELHPSIGYKYGNDYIDSKYQAHQLVLQAVDQGQDAVIVNPTFMIGPYDSAPSSGAMILAVFKGQVPGYASGGKNYICAKDAARGVVNAITLGRKGESYILGNENLNYREAFEKIARVTGSKPPNIAFPNWALKVYGAAGSIKGRLSGKAPKVSYTMARIACDGFYYSSEKAQKELLLPQTPLEVGIREAFDWFKEHKYI